MYEVNLSGEARDTVSHLPLGPLKELAEFLDLLSLDPYVGNLYRRSGSDLRTAAVAGDELLVVWLVLESQERVEVLRLVWLGYPPEG